MSKFYFFRASFLIAFSFIVLGGVAAQQKRYPLPVLPKPVREPVFSIWEVGATGGVVQGQTDLTNFGNFQQNPAGQIFLRRHLNESFALRGNVLFGKLSGTDEDYPVRAPRGFSYTTPLSEFSLLMEVDLLGPLRYKRADGKFRRVVSPYVYGGIGYALTAPRVNYNETDNAAILNLIRQDKANTRNNLLPVPVGFGLKLDFDEHWVVSAEAGARLLFSDYLDGISATGGKKGRDTYTFIGISLSYRMDRR